MDANLLDGVAGRPTGGQIMPSKLKKRRIRRLREDVAWYKAEATDWQKRVFELADEVAALRAKLRKLTGRGFP